MFAPRIRIYNWLIIIFRPYGTVRLSDAQRQSLSKNYLDVEGQLVKAKTSLLLKENEREEMTTKIASLQSAVSNILFPFVNISWLA